MEPEKRLSGKVAIVTGGASGIGAETARTFARHGASVVLCDLQEMDYLEAAGVVGCAVGTIRSRLHRARALLMEKMRASERCAV